MKNRASIKKGALYVSISSLLFVSWAVYSRSNTNTDPAYTSNRTSAPIVVHHASPAAAPVVSGKKKIKIALLLDTSGSMDGLIDQARAQLWKLVNELTLAKCNNEKPELEIALYEYGNDGLPSSEGYIRQISMFTHDLDLISEQLFSLKTNGGSEFCGQVIATATKQLDWQANSQDLQLIFIAGNEEFTQGAVKYTESCLKAKEKDIVVNTIFCGDYSTGLSTGWKNGAILTNGSYMNIEQDKKTVYIETPYDNEIAQLNDKLNATYINYGSIGYEKKANQLKQDKNAETYGAANTTNRVVSKASSFYSNSTWDLVDASKEKDFDIAKIKENELPDELKGKTKEQKQQYVADKTKERQEIIKQIQLLNEKRTVYIAEKSKTMGTNDQSLDAAMIKAIREQAAKKNFVFDI